MANLLFTTAGGFSPFPETDITRLRPQSALTTPVGSDRPDYPSLPPGPWKEVWGLHVPHTPNLKSLVSNRPPPTTSDGLRLSCGRKVGRTPGVWGWEERQVRDSSLLQEREI